MGTFGEIGLAGESTQAAAVDANNGIAADLIAVLVAVTAGDPRVLTIQGQSALPSGPFELAHRSLQAGLRSWVERQTKLPLGYVEQLYTFADQDRGGAGQHVISISYLGLNSRAARLGRRWSEMARLVFIFSLGRPSCRHAPDD